MRPAIPVPPVWLAIVAALALAVYANSLAGALLYDDLNAITHNTRVVEGDVRGIVTTASWWGDDRGHLWRPLTTLTFALDHALFGLAPFPYHLENVLLHALVSMLVLVVFAAVGAAPATAFAAALLFASHPVHTEAVANVVGRAELIAAAGFLLAWWCWIAADATRGGRRTAWLWAAALAYLLAMLGKENAIALPAVLLLGDLLPGREPSNAEAATRRTLRYVPLLAAALAFVALRGAIVGRVTPAPELLDNPLGLMAPGPRLLTAVAVIGRYALRLVFPLWLSADYSYDQIPAVATPLDPGFLAGAAVIVTVAVLVWSSWRRAPEIALGLGMLALTFALVSNLVVPIGTIMGERLLYLPSAGFCLALAAALVRLAPASDATATSARWPPAVMAALAVVVALYGARTVSRNTIWREPLVFFATMARDAPRSARSHAELATALAEAGRLDEAGPSFERALAIKPEDAVVLYNWGNALGSAGRWDDAADKYQRAITAKPNFGEAFENLGGVESARGNQEAALAALDRARELTPNSPYLLMTTANVLARAGSIAAARSTYERALAERPEDPTVRRQYEEFLRAHPNATVEAER